MFLWVIPGLYRLYSPLKLRVIYKYTPVDYIDSIHIETSIRTDIYRVIGHIPCAHLPFLV